MFPDFGLILLKIILFYMEIEPGWLRNGPEYLKKSFWSWKQAQKSILDPETEIFKQMKFSVWGSQIDYWGYIQDQNDF